MDWDQMYRSHQIRHEELIAESREWKRGRDIGAKEDQERAEEPNQEPRIHVSGCGRALELLSADGQKAAGC